MKKIIFDTGAIDFILNSLEMNYKGDKNKIAIIKKENNNVKIIEGDLNSLFNYIKN